MCNCCRPLSPPHQLLCHQLNKTPSTSAWSWLQEIQTKNAFVGTNRRALASVKAHRNVLSCCDFCKTPVFFPIAPRGRGPDTIWQRFLKLDCLRSPFNLRRVKPSLNYTSIYSKIVHQIQGPGKNSVLPARRNSKPVKKRHKGREKLYTGSPRSLGTSTIYTPPASIIHLLMLSRRYLALFCFFERKVTSHNQGKADIA